MILEASIRQAGLSIRENAMNDFHVLLHAGESTTSKFSKSFEQVSEAFESLPRMFLEPDGSFVWVIEQDEERFQLDGLLTDDGANLLHCELKGNCNAAILDQLLRTLGWPDQEVAVQLVEEGTFLQEADFRKRYVD